MKLKLISAVRLALYLTGIVVLALVVWFLFRGVVRTVGPILFVIYIVLSVFAIALLPSVFSFQVDDGLVIGSIIYYRGVIVYAIISFVIVLITLLAKKVTPLIVILEVAALFILFIYLYTSYRMARNTVKVRTKEQEKKAVLDALKAQAVLLRQRADMLTEEGDPFGERIKKLTESVRYLSPSEATEAATLEKQLLDMMTAVDFSDLSHQRVQEMELLYQQRKTL